MPAQRAEKVSMTISQITLSVLEVGILFLSPKTFCFLFSHSRINLLLFLDKGKISQIFDKTQEISNAKGISFMNPILSLLRAT
jgi:hypothetical protein